MLFLVLFVSLFGHSQEDSLPQSCVQKAKALATVLDLDYTQPAELRSFQKTGEGFYVGEENFSGIIDFRCQARFIVSLSYKKASDVCDVIELTKMQGFHCDPL
ncbi:MAG: hypothetical protein K2Q26_08710 [Bdellovibrionales bacterium]|nr:hypothetical protein [Bdellovibrionales bacterium]